MGSFDDKAAGNGKAPFKVLIVGAGLGGLSCAIACRRRGVEVELLERAPSIEAVGAGIQIPPNAARVLARYGLLEQLEEHAIKVENLDMRRFEDGRMIVSKPLRGICEKVGFPWLVIHREDYHRILLQEAERLGTKITLDANVTDINCETGEIIVGEHQKLKGDVVVGADGLWSTIRGVLLGTPFPPIETGDLAYRGTFSREQLLELNDARITSLCDRKCVTLWMGPEKHVVFYPVRSGTQFNMVLLRPDDLPQGIRTVHGDIGEMRATFQGWDEILHDLQINQDDLLHTKRIEVEVVSFHRVGNMGKGMVIKVSTQGRGSVALLGDACHPTLPYQAQGAAMAVEDGAVLGTIVADLKRSLDAGSGRFGSQQESVASALKMYEKLRKARTTNNVLGAVENRTLYHMPDGPEQRKRDEVLGSLDYDSASWKWANTTYQLDLLGYDAVAAAESAFKAWESSPNPEISSHL